MIGGMFEKEKIGNVTNAERANTIYAMSGRCALYACLLDMDIKGEKTAYVPAYTCETVLSSYLKAGFSLRFYDTDPEGLVSLFKEEDLKGVSVLGICGYYGFVRYDEKFVKKAREKGIEVLLDTTHSPTYIDPYATYEAGSLRKWMGIASGGIAFKSASPFKISLLPPDKEHLEGRYKAMEKRSLSLSSGDLSYDAKASETFWNTEMRLRKMFDAYDSDEYSKEVIRHYDFDSMIKIRRANFNTIIKNLKDPKGWRPIFTKLRESDVPSHFSLYADDRDSMQKFLKQRGVNSTVYWPEPPMLDDIDKYPGSKYIMQHIMSIQLDQRYERDDMEMLAYVLNSYSEHVAQA